LLTSPDVGADVELAESVSMAMLTVLETLGPAERAVFVLHEVFDTPYDEIAEAVGKSPAAVRQIAHRARGHVAARRQRVPRRHTSSTSSTCFVLRPPRSQVPPRHAQAQRPQQGNPCVNVSGHPNHHRPSPTANPLAWWVGTPNDEGLPELRAHGSRAA
jgi:hypothetical protein